MVLPMAPFYLVLTAPGINVWCFHSGIFSMHYVLRTKPPHSHTFVISVNWHNHSNKLIMFDSSIQHSQSQSRPLWRSAGRTVDTLPHRSEICLAEVVFEFVAPPAGQTVSCCLWAFHRHSVVPLPQSDLEMLACTVSCCSQYCSVLQYQQNWFIFYLHVVTIFLIADSDTFKP